MVLGCIILCSILSLGIEGKMNGNMLQNVHSNKNCKIQSVQNIVKLEQNRSLLRNRQENEEVEKMARRGKKKMEKLTVGSVCSGIEAASVAFIPLGFDFRWFSEIASFPSKLLSTRYNSVTNVGDMMCIADSIRKGMLETPDLICGGTPCQAFSYAGWQKGLQDDRGNLTLRFVDIVDANDEKRLEQGKSPTVVLWENVEGVLSDKTNAFGCFVSSLAGLNKVLDVNGRWPSAGFLRGSKRTVVWRVIDAKYFGVPQQRRRLYVIAGPEDIHPEKILFEKHTDHPDVEYKQEGASFVFQKDGHTFEVFRVYSDCLYSSYATKWNGNAAAYNGSLFVVQDGHIRRFSPLECERLMGFPDGYTDIPLAKKSNRYQALGNSWAVPVIKWIGERLVESEQDFQLTWFPIQSENDYEYHDLSKGLIPIGDGIVLNCTMKPENVVLGNMEDVVSAYDVPDVYLSPVGCAGILRRKKERDMSMNKRLEEVLSASVEKMPPSEIERKSRVQKRGKYSNPKKENRR